MSRMFFSPAYCKKWIWYYYPFSTDVPILSTPSPENIRKPSVSWILWVHKWDIGWKWVTYLIASPNKKNNFCPNIFSSNLVMLQKIIWKPHETDRFLRFKRFYPYILPWNYTCEVIIWKHSQVYSETCQTSKMEHFAKNYFTAKSS